MSKSWSGRRYGQFAESELAPVAAEIDRDHRFPYEVVPKMAALNLLGMPYPEEVGGAGADYVSYVIALEEVSRACATTAVITTAQTTLATWPIFKFGTQAQKDKYLHDMASGRRLGAFALTEPAAGTDAGAGTATAVLSGGEYSSTDRRSSSPTPRTPRSISSSRRPTRRKGRAG